VYPYPGQPAFGQPQFQAPKPTRPASVTVAFYLVVGAAIGWGMFGATALWQLSVAADIMEDAANKVGASQSQLDAAYATINAVNIVESVVAGLMLVGLVLLGLFAYRGGNAVRWVLVSLLGLSSVCCCGGVLISLAQGTNTNSTDTATQMLDEYSKMLADREPVVMQALALVGPLMLVLFGLTALVLLVVPVSNRYFRKVVDPHLPVMMGPDGYPVYYGGPGYPTSAPPAWYPPQPASGWPQPGSPTGWPAQGPPGWPQPGSPAGPTDPSAFTMGWPQPGAPAAPPGWPQPGAPTDPVAGWPAPAAPSGPGWPQAGSPPAWPGTPMTGPPAPADVAPTSGAPSPDAPPPSDSASGSPAHSGPPSDRPADDESEPGSASRWAAPAPGSEDSPPKPPSDGTW
jgi:hypothetical protein